MSAIRSKNTPRKKCVKNVPSKRLEDYFEGGVSSLVFWAFRYFLGRRTASSCSFAKELARAIPKLDDYERNLIQHELDREFESDDSCRNSGDRFRPLGDDCDRAAWDLVRQAYRKQNQS